ncbi:radical SAM protein [bacterium CPR1]|nr:radical SAM protein [bacterium CPR1]
MEKPRVLLVFPPQWTPLNPHFALAALNGHLRERGHEVKLLDLNVRYYRRVLTRKYLEFSLAKARNAIQHLMPKTLLNLRLGERTARTDRENVRLLQIEQVLAQDNRRTLEDIDEAVSVFDDPEKFYDPIQLTWAYVTVDRALDIASLPYWPIRVRFNDLVIPRLPLTVEAVKAFATNRDENPYLTYFEAQLAEIQAYRPDVIGISINAHAQLVPGLTLAWLLRRRGTAHVTLGGNHLIRIKEGVLRSPEFLTSFAHSVILGEGETPLDGLLHALEHGHDLSRVPGLVYADPDEKPVYTFECSGLSLNSRALPSLEGLPLADYFSPEPVLTIRSSKGCYWKKCTFCDTDYGVCPDNRSVENLVDEMQALQEKWGVSDYCFIDECIVPRYMERVVDCIEQRGLKVHWYGNGRLETSFTTQRLDRLRQGGLTMLLWGLESGSDRIMKLINKGIKLDKRLEILKNSSDSGIWNFCYIFFGFPSETEEEGLQTIEMIESNTDIIHSYGRSVFTLNKHAKLHTDPSTLGILEMVGDPEELSANLDYRVSDEGAKQRARKLAQLCKFRCALAYGDPLWMHLRYREVMHLYLKRHGRDFVANYRFDPAAKAARLGLSPDGPTLVGIDNP